MLWLPGNKPRVYLDMAPWRRISESPELSARFVSALKKSCGTLCVSIVTLLDMAGLGPGDSEMAIRRLAAAVEGQWFLLEMRPHQVLRKQAEGKNELDSFRSNTLCDLHYIGRKGEESLLNATIGRAFADREGLISIRDKYAGEMLRETQKAQRHFRNHKLNKYSIPFSEETALEYCYRHFMDLLVAHNIELDINHMVDWYHACVPCVFCDYVVLDKTWQDFTRQIKLPKGYVKVYKVGQLDAFLTDFEAHSGNEND